MINSAQTRTLIRANYAQGHRTAGPVPSQVDWPCFAKLADTLACDVAPSHGFVGMPGGRLIDPGDAGNSIVITRMSRRDVMGMPPLASNLVDADGVALVTQWVNQLTGCF